MDSVKDSQTLEQQRLYAAQASGGVSSNVIYNQIIKVIEERDLGGSVLDYGAGIGNLTKRLSVLSRFRQITGADILPRPQDLPDPIRWYCLDLNSGEPIPSSRFDALIAAEVIEHLENPREVARDWYRLLKPGGTLVLSTPNNESIRSLLSLLIRGHYAAFDDPSYPAHITALLRKDLLRILREAGFSHIRFQFTNFGCVPKLLVLNWQQISFGILKGCRFSDNVIVTAMK